MTAKCHGGRLINCLAPRILILAISVVQEIADGKSYPSLPFPFPGPRKGVQHDAGVAAKSPPPPNLSLMCRTGGDEALNWSHNANCCQSAYLCLVSICNIARSTSLSLLTLTPTLLHHLLPGPATLLTETSLLNSPPQRATDVTIWDSSSPLSLSTLSTSHLNVLLKHGPSVDRGSVQAKKKIRPIFPSDQVERTGELLTTC